jgi:hypothetical protein
MISKTVTLSIGCVIAIAGLLGTVAQTSSGQQEPNIRKQPACTIYCGDGPDTINLGAKPCWGGPLPAARAGDHFKSLAEEDQAAICRNVATASTRNASCPAFKALAQLCRGKERPPDPEDKKPPCKERNPNEPPWFDPSAEDCQQLQDTRLNANWTAANGGTCTITLTACNYAVLTYTINYVHEENGGITPLNIEGIRNQVTPEQLVAMGDRPIKQSECDARLYDAQAGDHPNKVCCDIWREGVSAGGGCNPERDADCDGLPNDRDGFLNSRPYYAPARPGTWDAQFFDGKPADFNPANFDPRPPGLNWDEVMPNEPCKKCKWMAQSGKLACSPDGKTEHVYKVTWLCPSSGATRIVTKRAPASSPCTLPRRG